MHMSIPGSDDVMRELRLDGVTGVQNRCQQLVFRLVVDARQVRSHSSALLTGHVALGAVLIEQRLAARDVAVQFQDIAIGFHHLGAIAGLVLQHAPGAIALLEQAGSRGDVQRRHLHLPVLQRFQQQLSPGLHTQHGGDHLDPRGGAVSAPVMQQRRRDRRVVESGQRFHGCGLQLGRRSRLQRLPHYRGGLRERAAAQRPNRHGPARNRNGGIERVGRGFGHQRAELEVTRHFPGRAPHRLRRAVDQLQQRPFGGRRFQPHRAGQREPLGQPVQSRGGLLQPGDSVQRRRQFRRIMPSAHQRGKLRNDLLHASRQHGL